MRKPNINLELHKTRRQKLAQVLKGSALVIPAHPEMIRNNDVYFPYRQDSNFYYLTGFEEPESLLVFRPGLDPEYALFVRRKDALRETWDGFRYGPDGAKSEFGCDAVYPIDDLEIVLPKLLAEVSSVYYRLFQNYEFDRKLKTALEKVKLNNGRSGLGLLPIHDSTELIGEMRVIKDEVEKKNLREACRITATAHKEMMKHARVGMSERDLQCIIEYQFMKLGAQRLAYNSIVAGGANACTLHYVFNDQDIAPKALVLIDAGAEFNYYCGDITRSFPINGTFNEEQKIVYDKVLKVQKHILTLIKPGIEFRILQDTTIDMLTGAMLELGALKGSVAINLEQNTYKKYYPHGVSHWLGMDVHDAGLYKVRDESRKLQEGMCFTVEPGLYFPADDASIPMELRGIGIRIEDDILVTENGCEVLTKDAPKEIKDIEAIVGTENS